MLGSGQSSASAGKELTAPHQFPPWLMRLHLEGITTHEDPHHRHRTCLRGSTWACPSDSRRRPRNLTTGFYKRSSGNHDTCASRASPTRFGDA